MALVRTTACSSGLPLQGSAIQVYLGELMIHQQDVRRPLGLDRKIRGRSGHSNLGSLPHPFGEPQPYTLVAQARAGSPPRFD